MNPSSDNIIYDNTNELTNTTSDHNILDDRYQIAINNDVTTQTFDSEQETNISSEGINIYDDLDNPFIASKITPLEYDSDDNEVIGSQLRLIYDWNFEFNYDYYFLKNISLFWNKNSSECKFRINNIKELRSISDQRSHSGNVIKLKNIIKLQKNNIAHVYLIVYYDNIKCNIEFYGLFTEQIDTDIMINQIIKEGKYGPIGRMHNSTMSSTEGNGFNIIYNSLVIL